MVLVLVLLIKSFFEIEQKYEHRRSTEHEYEITNTSYEHLRKRKLIL